MDYRNIAIISFKTIAFILAAVFLYSCASKPEIISDADIEVVQLMPLDESYINTNRLIYHQTSLSLPDGWIFYQPDREQRKGVFLHFKDRNDNVLGSFEYLSFDFKIKSVEIVRYYLESVLGDYENKEIKRAAIGNSKAYFISVKHPNTSDVVTALIIEGNNVNVIELVGADNYLKENLDMAYRIFQSYKYMQKGISVRVIKGSQEFYCYDGNWAWDNDFRGGFFIRGKISDRDSVLGIWEIAEKNTQELYTEHGNFDIKPFDAYFFINNEKIFTQGTGLAGKNGFMQLYYVVEYMGKNYCIFLNIDNKSTKVRLQDLHKSKNIVDLFRFNLLL